MAKKLTNYNPSTTLVSGLTPAGDLDVPLMEAHDIVVDYVNDENNVPQPVRLDDKLDNLTLSADKVITGTDDKGNETTLSDTLSELDNKIGNQEVSADNIKIGDKTLSQTLTELKKGSVTPDGDTIIMEDDGTIRGNYKVATKEKDGLMTSQDRNLLHPFTTYEDKLIEGTFTGINPPVKEKSGTHMWTAKMIEVSFAGNDDRARSLHTVTGSLQGSWFVDSNGYYKNSYSIELPLTEPEDKLLVQSINVTSTGSNFEYSHRLDGNILFLTTSSQTNGATHTYEIKYIGEESGGTYTKRTITLPDVKEFCEIQEVTVENGHYSDFSWVETSLGVIELRINDTYSSDIYICSVTYDTKSTATVDVTLEDYVIAEDAILGILVDGVEREDVTHEYIDSKTFRIVIPDTYSSRRYSYTIQYGIPAPYETTVRVPFEFHELIEVIIREDSLKVEGADTCKLKYTSDFGTVDIIVESNVKGQNYKYSFLVGHSEEIPTIEDRLEDVEQYKEVFEDNIITQAEPGGDLKKRLVAVALLDTYYWVHLIIQVEKNGATYTFNTHGVAGNIGKQMNSFDSFITTLSSMGSPLTPYSASVRKEMRLTNGESLATYHVGMMRCSNDDSVELFVSEMAEEMTWLGSYSSVSSGVIVNINGRKITGDLGATT